GRVRTITAGGSIPTPDYPSRQGLSRDYAPSWYAGSAGPPWPRLGPSGLLVRERVNARVPIRLARAQDDGWERGLVDGVGDVVRLETERALLGVRLAAAPLLAEEEGPGVHLNRRLVREDRHRAARGGVAQ